MVTLSMANLLLQVFIFMLLMVGNGTHDTLLARPARGASVRVHALRRDEQLERHVRLGRAELTAEIKLAAKAKEDVVQQRRAWLGK